MKLRGIATPLTIGSFILVCVTGLCLLFGLRGGLIDPLHELSSIVLVIGVAFQSQGPHGGSGTRAALALRLATDCTLARTIHVVSTDHALEPGGKRSINTCAASLALVPIRSWIGAMNANSPFDLQDAIDADPMSRAVAWSAIRRNVLS